jgi:hypothetical protein
MEERKFLTTILQCCISNLPRVSFPVRNVYCVPLLLSFLWFRPQARAVSFSVSLFPLVCSFVCSSFYLFIYVFPHPGSLFIFFFFVFIYLLFCVSCILTPCFFRYLSSSLPVLPCFFLPRSHFLLDTAVPMPTLNVFVTADRWMDWQTTSPYQGPPRHRTTQPCGRKATGYNRRSKCLETP